MINNANDDHDFKTFSDDECYCSDSTQEVSLSEEDEEEKAYFKAKEDILNDRKYLIKDVIGNVGFCLVMFAGFVVALPFIALAYAGCGTFLAVSSLVDLVRGGE